MKEYTVRVYDDRTEWHQNGNLHREDGPAVELADGGKYWYLNGESLTEKEFNDRLNPVELTLGEIATKFNIPVEQLKIKTLSNGKEDQRKFIEQIMRWDEELGLYDLSRADLDKIINDNKNAPTPNEALIKAYEKYKNRINKDE